ncbi:uncharacterized protein [Diadema setosum]
MGYHISDEDQRYYVLGLRDIPTKSASDTLSTFKELLQDLDEATLSASDAGKKILANIRNTMSDRAATELKWHELLQKYRSDVLPTIQENWQNLSDEEKQPLENITSFFCGLHSLVQYAEVCEKTLDSVETSLFDGKGAGALVKGLAFKTEGNGVLRLVKNASKAFARGGNEQSGVYGPFKLFTKEFLQENGFSKVPIVPFRGNRFNIMFFNAGFIFFLHKQMTSFLDSYGASNKLLKCVEADLKEPFYLAGCRALGLISKHVTAPLWRILEDKAVHILDLPQVYSRIQETLGKGTDNPQQFIDGQLSPFQVSSDAVLDSLTNASEHDGLTCSILKNLLPALAQVMKSHAAHLEVETTDDQRASTKSVAKHNKFAERVFAYLDHLMRVRPNATLLGLEATIMFSLNKTSEWLKSLPDQEAKKLISTARKHSRKLKAQFKERVESIRQQKREAMKEKEREKQRREEKRQADLEFYTQEIQYYGLWQSEREVEEMVNSFRSDNDKVKALKSQLRFRQHVLRQTASRPEVYNFSSKGTAHSWQTLQSNVKELVRQAFTLPPPSVVDEGVPLLVGRRINHKFQEGDYNGKVLSCVPGYPEWFNVKYDNDDAIYSCKLNEDYKNGDIKILC